MKTVLLFISAAFFCLSIAAQDRPAITAQPNSVFVGAEGKFESAPDTALLQFNISAQEATSKAAYDRASRNADQIREIKNKVLLYTEERAKTLSTLKNHYRHDVQAMGEVFVELDFEGIE